MNVLKAILPLLIVSILVIITIMRLRKIDTSDKQIADKISYGINLGSLFGLSIALSIKMDIVYGLSFGMLIGIIMSTFYNKENKE